MPYLLSKKGKAGKLLGKLLVKLLTVHLRARKFFFAFLIVFLDTENSFFMISEERCELSKITASNMQNE